MATPSINPNQELPSTSNNNEPASSSNTTSRAVSSTPNAVSPETMVQSAISNAPAKTADRAVIGASSSSSSNPIIPLPTSERARERAIAITNPYSELLKDLQDRAAGLRNFGVTNEDRQEIRERIQLLQSRAEELLKVRGPDNGEGKMWFADCFAVERAMQALEVEAQALAIEALIKTDANSSSSSTFIPNNISSSSSSIPVTENVSSSSSSTFIPNNVSSSSSTAFLSDSPYPEPLKGLQDRVIRLKNITGAMNASWQKIDKKIRDLQLRYELIKKAGHARIENGEDKAWFADCHSLGEELEKLITLEETNKPPKEIVRVGPFLQLANGAVKQVWIKDGNVSKVFYTALAGNRSAEAELRAEVAIATVIRKNLFREVYLAFLGNELFRLLSGDAIGYLATAFTSVQDLKDALETPELGRKISSTDLELLRKYFASLQGRVALEKANARGSHIAIDIIESSEKIGSNYTVETARADGDLETLLRQPNLYTIDHQIDIISQILKGMADLHKSGHVHGDIKPENVLVFYRNGRWIVKISDFGKTEAMLAEKSGIHWGNTRFAPWENRLSQTGDVCSTGIKLIRILEQRILVAKRSACIDPELAKEIRSLIKPRVLGSQVAAFNLRKKKIREGIEVFVIEGRCFNAIEADHTKRQATHGRFIQALKKMVGNFESQTKEIDEERNRYINALQTELMAINFGPTLAVDALCNLIRDMTHIDPAQRPTMEQASQRFELIKWLFTPTQTI